MVTSNDITTNLPYVAGAHMAFDHHHSEVERVGGGAANHVIGPSAPSAAGVVYERFGGAERPHHLGRDDGGGRQGRRRAVRQGGHHRAVGLGADELR